jgi:hypothetical protein
MIHSTTNYEQFDFHEFNRAVDDAHLRRLKTHIKKHGLVQPILVTKDGMVIDGQHRLHICRELGIPVLYIVRTEMDMQDVVSLNNMSKRWTVLDKVRSFAAQGNENYVRLIGLWEKCKEIDPKITIRTASMLAQGSAARKYDESGSMNLGVGTWEFRDTTENAMKRLYILCQFKRWPFYLKNNFVTALLRCVRTVEDFDWKELLKKAEMNPQMFMHAGTTQEYMRMFERVYNHKKRKHTRFF